jgi:isopropylmalate/homocitrate/citramalate synthase
VKLAKRPRIHTFLATMSGTAVQAEMTREHALQQAVDLVAYPAISAGMWSSL